MTIERAEAPPRPPNNLVGMAILAAFAATALGLAVSPAAPGPLTFTFVLLGWVLAVMAHEFAHAWVAWKGGDRTVKAKGYLSFDPRRYGDLWTSLLIPLLALALGGIGFPGGAVYLRPDLMRSRLSRAAASLAGPLATLVVLLALAYGLGLWTHSAAATNALYDALAMLAFLQATALLLNLLPLPGLDGFNALRPFLPLAWGPAIGKVETLAMVALLAALLLLPGLGAALFGAAADLVAALGVPRAAIAAAWETFHFWR